MKDERIIRKTEGGFIALTSVLIIGAIILILGVSIFYASLTDQTISTAYQNSQEADFLADFCLREGVSRLEEDINYDGGEEIVIGDKSCYIGVVDDIPPNTKKVSSLGKAGERPHFSRASQLVIYAIEPATGDWSESGGTLEKVRASGDSLTLILSQEEEVSSTLDSYEEWNVFFDDRIENIEITEGGSLVLAETTPPPEELGSLGESCIYTSDCQSGLFCVDDVCCGSDACPTCQACDVVDYGGSCHEVTTNWGAGTYGCGSVNEDKRCYGAIGCVDCGETGGYFYSDGCNCVSIRSAENKVCWRKAGANQNCDTFCNANYGGCIVASWNDDINCTVCKTLTGYTVCSGGAAQVYAPYGIYFTAWGIPSCFYRSSGSQACSTAPGADNMYRMCVCQY